MIHFRDEYKVWYKDKYAGNTESTRSIVSWALGKDIRYVVIEKNGIEVTNIKSCNGDVSMLEKILREFQPIMLEDDLFTI